MAGPTVSSGQTLTVTSAVSGVTVLSGGTLVVASGGMATATQVFNGGVENVSSGGSAISGNIASGAMETVFSGGVDSGSNVARGGSLTVSNGGNAFDTKTTNGGTLSILSGGTETLTSGNVVYNADIRPGGTLIVGSGATAVAPRPGGTLTINSGGTATQVVLSSGGTISGAPGATINTISVASGGSLAITSGVSATGVSVQSGGLLTVNSGAIVRYAVVNTGGQEVVSSGGTVSASFIRAGGLETVYAGGIDSGSVVSAATLVVSSGGRAYDTHQTAGGAIVVSSGGSELVTSGAIVYSATLLTGGTEVVSSGGIAVATAIDGGRLTLQNGGRTATSIIFGAGSGTLEIDSPTPPTTTISGFLPGDGIDLAALPFVGGGTVTLGAGNRLTVTEGSQTATLNLNPSQNYTGFTFGLAPDGGTGTLITIACFLAGTLIATERGDVAVEALQAGDTVRTAAGGTAPIVWTGSRRIDAAAHPRPHTVLPIRIRKDAIAEGQPRRDLLVSPDHAILLDGKLIAARLLVNGTSVTQDASVTEPHYVHIELERHDIVLAEGLPTESYLDGGQRGVFANAAEPLVLHPDLSLTERREGSCVEFATDVATVRAAWTRIAARADAATVATAATTTAAAAAASFRVEVDGRSLQPIAADGRHVFALPPGAATVRIAAPTFRPDERAAWLDDRRDLGLCVTGLTVQTAAGTQTIALDGPALTTGWWSVETADGRPFRWTAAAADLLLPAGALLLTIAAAGTPAAASAQDAARTDAARTAA